MRFKEASEGFRAFQEVSGGMAKVERFEDLVIWQQARRLSKEVYEITRLGDFRYDSRFVQQIRAAVGSIMDNIAEGFERDGNKEFVQFLYIAKGSCGEVRSQIYRAFDAGFINEETFTRMLNETLSLNKGILNFIKSLKSSAVTGTKYQKPTPLPPPETL